jgi:RNA polymerase sigma-70 factor, ECF subfamily
LYVNENDAGANEELMTRALAGEAAAFGSLVRAHQGSVYSLALRMLSDRYEAEDLAQEVFLGLHHNLSSVESAAHLGFWLRKVTLNRAIDRLRRRRPDRPLEEASSVPCDPTDSDPLLQRRLRALLAQLAPAPRAVVLLRYQEDLNPNEIARTLNMSINTVKSHLKRSLATLRERIGSTVHGERRRTVLGSFSDDTGSLI